MMNKESSIVSYHQHSARPLSSSAANKQQIHSLEIGRFIILISMDLTVETASANKAYVSS
jgi:hypothetical protein